MKVSVRIEMTETYKLPYVIAAPWWVKILSIPVIAAYVWGIISFNEWIHLWFEGNWPAKFLLLFFWFVLPFYVLAMWLTKTVLQDNCIIHRNFFLLKKRFLYENVNKIKVVRGNDVKVYFIDGSSIRILTGTNQVNDVIDIIRSKVDI